MAEFPEYKKGAAVRGDAVKVDAPKVDLKKEADPDRDPQERIVDQQWRDAEANRLGEHHPLALNRDTERTS